VGLRLHDGVRPCRHRDADKHGDNSRGETEAQGFAQQERADERSNDRIDGDGNGDARRGRVLQRESPQEEGQRAAERAKIERRAPLGSTERRDRGKAAGPSDAGLYKGPNFPLSRLESRPVCPSCGNRRMTAVLSRQAMLRKWEVDRV
jgi:hypothetical protein